ncbi:FAD-binding oxidoreductase [Thiomicrospira microaerophila]|uniref:FAD-binding and (Fe-S)-binding domain-containing protein n=1 Tax=Thiomicrospira microaerophila TaxID=406020 RepID=UPI00200C3FB3|nr:FAD-binding and (Fe-S)-binding domain-containing protein [Thiomicrospira microaerophila]UQB43028.1 FAD-binding oxidoreductase [Thiomicrospira microaerophila]
MLYSTDASVFELKPSGVKTPQNREGLVSDLREALALGEAITLRGAGTSLAGQAIGEGLIVDISRHLNQVFEYRPQQQRVKVEPGMVLDELNHRLGFDGLFFPIDTSTSNRATLGGVISNNSAGAKSVYFGTPRDWVVSLDALLSDGSEVCFEPLDEVKLQNKLALDSLEGAIYRRVIELLTLHKQAILDSAVDASLIRRNTGYALDVLVRDYQPFNPAGKPFNLTPLVCGAEGTLCAITAATLNLTEKPKYSQLICAHFATLEQALNLIKPLLLTRPAAIELIDQATLDCTLHNAEQTANRFWVEGEPAAVLVIELFGDSLSVLKKNSIEQQAWLLKQGAYAAPLIASHQAHQVWALRKAGLGLLMGKRTRKKAVAVIEDASVPAERLTEFYHAVNNLLSEHQLSAVFYGHASVGLIHIRPELDLADPDSRKTFADLAEKFASLVKQYNGALSGEHGDGRLRSPFLRHQVGDEVYGVWQQIKSVFDPKNQFNPGVILTDKSVLQPMRADRQPLQKLKGGFDWRNDISLMDAVEKCNGAGACRKANGVMCPSYQVSREEAYSTRGRSNLLRWALTEPDPVAALSQTELQDALSHCLACKACKTECPASVDMARLKAEVSYQLKPSKLIRWTMTRQKALMAWSQKHPKKSDWLMGLGLSRRALGLDERRPLPKMGDFDLQDWWLNQPILPADNQQKVWVLVDLYSQYQEPEVGKATLQSLVKLGFDVRPVFMNASPRALISQGLLAEASNELANVIKALSNLALDDYIIGIEPSEVLTWRDEAKDLLPKRSDAFEYRRVMLYEELLVDLVKQQRLPAMPVVDKKLWLHVHCHQKSLAKPSDVNRLLSQIPGLVVHNINTGCCGMAGDFGYKHYEMSVKIAQQTLLPALEQVAETDWVVATGLSCRQQISDLAGKHSYHIAQLFNQLLPNNSIQN